MIRYASATGTRQLAVLLLVITVIGVAAANLASVSAQTEPPREPTESTETSQAWFAKYDGIDGESVDANHDKWIDILAIDWGANKPGAGATGQSRRRGAAVLEDMTLTMEYEKASPKLIEAALEGKVIPKLEIEMTSTYGGARATYLKYELKNVQVTSYEVSGAASDDAPPTVVIGNNFEEIKVTYTEYDNEGGKKGNVEYNWKVEKGEK